MLIIMPLALPEQRTTTRIASEQGNRAICSARRSVGPLVGRKQSLQTPRKPDGLCCSGKKALLTVRWGLVEPSGRYCGTLPPRRSSRRRDRPGRREPESATRLLVGHGDRLLQREQYRRKEDEVSHTFRCQAAARELDCSPSDFQVVPEGGSNEAGFQGSKRILDPAISSPSPML